MRNLVLSTLVAVCGFAGAALAQQPGAQIQKPLYKPAAAAPTSGNVELLCRNFEFGSMPNGAPFRSSVVKFESVTVADSTGRTRQLYAPTRILLIHQFKPARAPAGPRGERLSNGECGLATSVIAGDSSGDTSTLPQMQFLNFPTMTVGAAKKEAASSNIDVGVTLPPCASGIRRFQADIQSAGIFFITGNTPNVATCIE